VKIVEKYFFKERRAALIVRFWRLILKNRTSSPYLSGDSFAKLCDYSAFGKDGSKRLNIQKLRESRRLFVPSHKLDELLSNNFDDINARVLICGNSDHNFTQEISLPASVKLWLCQNYAVENGFGQLLPIGLENLRLGKSGFKRFHRASPSKKIANKVLVPPMNITNPMRSLYLSKCEALPHLFNVHRKILDTNDYFKLISNYKFILVMEGNGFDTHRLWEVLYQGAIPILIESSWSRNLQKAGYNVRIICEISEANISQILQGEDLSLPSGPIPNYLFMDYWKKLVDNSG
jgi:hypothetical protein